GYHMGRILQQRQAPRVLDQDDVGFHSNELAGVESAALGVAAAPANLDPYVAAVRPSQFLQLLQQCRDAPLPLRVVLGEDGEHADSAHLVRRVLRPRGERPPGRRAAEQHDEFAPLHSITSSASASSFGGISRPSALAVLRLMTKSNLVGCTTGKSLGL